MLNFACAWSTKLPDTEPLLSAARRLCAVALAAAAFLLGACQGAKEPQPVFHDLQAEFVGREQCIDCHVDAYEGWLGSHHDDAMDFATADTVLGDFEDSQFEYNGITTRFYKKDDKFYVFTESAGGAMAEHEVLYTFGVEPLQQYLIAFPGGRLQALSTAWDTERDRWFFLYPDTEIGSDDWLHWTRNGQNWNGMCADCHSTNLRKNYDADTRTFDTQWSEIDVSCEACHGAGSRHVAWAAIDPEERPGVPNYGLEVQSTGIDGPALVEQCAACHARRAEIGDYDHAQVNMMETLVPSLLEQGTYHPDGQILEEVYVWGSYVQSKMYANNVSCRDCHDVHSLELKFEGNALCAQCHVPEVFDTPEHHHHVAISDGEPNAGAQCVNCHMPEQPYMVIDYRADHSMRVPRPDLTQSIGVPNACSSCHDDRSLDWVIDAYNGWYGTERKPHYGTALAAAHAGDAKAAEGLYRVVGDAAVPALARATALSALRTYPGDESNALLEQALGDEHALIRHAAVDTIDSPRPEQLAAWLAPKLEDPARAVRLRAAARLGTIGPEYLTAAQRVLLNESLDEYVSAMRGGLDFAAAGMNLGNLYSARGELREAERYYRDAIAVDDLFFPAKMNLAMILAQQGDEAEAERLFTEVLEAYPDRYDAAYSLALLLAGQSRLDESALYLARATEGMPLNSRAHYNYGLLLAQLGDDKQAEVALGTALELEPANLDYLYAIADFLLKRQRFDEALAIAERMIEAHPQQRIGYDIRAVIQRGNN